MTRWTLGTTDDDHYGVYYDGVPYFVAVSEDGEPEPAKSRAEWLVHVLNEHEVEMVRLRRMQGFGRRE